MAVAHAGLLLAAVFFGVVDAESWPTRLWVGMTTLWFLWPMILALHPGRSSRRVYAGITTAAVLLVLPLRVYDHCAPEVFAPEEMMLDSFSPYALVPYTIAYVRGWAEAKKHGNDRILTFEAFGFGTIAPCAPYFHAAARERYKVEYNHVAGCVVNSTVIGHAAGHNRATISELKHRFGAGVIDAVKQERQRWDNDYATAEKVGRNDAELEFKSGRRALELCARWPNVEETNEVSEVLGTHHVELRRRTDRVEDVTADVAGHARGYDEVMISEIRRTLGAGAAQELDALTAHYSYTSAQ